MSRSKTSIPYLSSIYALKRDEVAMSSSCSKKTGPNMYLQLSSDPTIRCPYSMLRSQANELQFNGTQLFQSALAPAKQTAPSERRMYWFVYITLHKFCTLTFQHSWHKLDEFRTQQCIMSVPLAQQIQPIVLLALTLLPEKFHMNGLIVKNTVSNAGTTRMLPGWNTSNH